MNEDPLPAALYMTQQLVQQPACTSSSFCALILTFSSTTIVPSDVSPSPFSPPTSTTASEGEGLNSSEVREGEVLGEGGMTTSPPFGVPSVFHSEIKSDSSSLANLSASNLRATATSPHSR
jgi:hypothetical protein